MFRRVFAIFFGFFLFFIFSFVTFYAFSKFTIQADQVDWDGVSGMMDTLMVILTLLLLLGLRQGAQSIDEANHSRNADLLNWAMEEMDKLKPAIKVVTDAHKRVPYCRDLIDLKDNYNSSWSEDELEAAHYVSIGLQRMGYYATHNLVSKKHYLNLWGPLYLSCWYSLEGWVKHKRLTLGEPMDIKYGAYSRMYFEKFAIYCEENLPELLLKNTREDFSYPSVERPKGIYKFFRKIKYLLDNQDIC